MAYKNHSILIRRFFVILLCLVLFNISALVGAQKIRVYDSGNLLESRELNQVQQALDRVSREFQTDLFILTSTTLGGVSPREHAENFFWGGNHGTQPDDSGVVLVIDMGERDVWMATFGRAIPTFQREVNRIIEGITPDLTAGNYGSAFLTFSRYMERPLQSTMVLPLDQRLFNTAVSWPPLVIALVVSLVITILLSLNSRGKKLVTNKTYEVPGTFKLTESQDVYIRTTTTRTKISSSSSSGGGGGRSSGGGGGKF